MKLQFFAKASGSELSRRTAASGREARYRAMLFSLRLPNLAYSVKLFEGRLSHQTLAALIRRNLSAESK